MRKNSSIYLIGFLLALSLLFTHCNKNEEPLRLAKTSIEGLEKGKKGLRLDEVFEIKVKGGTENPTDYSYSATPEGIVDIDAKGTVRARKSGSTQISVINKKNNKMRLSFKLDVEYEESQLNYTADAHYNLNVVYFVPKGQEPNFNYRRRLSDILLYYQDFVAEWMQKWGYGDKTFGMSMDKAEKIIKITTVYGKHEDYPYNGKDGRPRMMKEIEEHFKDNNLAYESEHTLVIAVTNLDLSDGKSKPNLPFYGYGKWCYAIDFKDMNVHDLFAGRYETSYVGGLLHELGHGLNLPHVGGCCSDLESGEFGTPLMSNGNITFGKQPTFMHPASCAILNNCQVVYNKQDISKDKKEFYKGFSGFIRIDSAKNKEGAPGTFVVKGTYSDSGAAPNATDIIVRFYNAKEKFLGGSDGYTSVAFVTKPNQSKFEAEIPCAELSHRDFEFKLATTLLYDNGTVTHGHYEEGNLSLERDADGNYLLKSRWDSRTGWTATATYAVKPSDREPHVGSPEFVIDGDGKTCLSLVKPGKKYLSVDASSAKPGAVYFTVDTKKPTTFKSVLFRHRTDNDKSFLRMHKVKIQGSNDGKKFVDIKEEALKHDEKTSEVIIDLDKEYTYQFIRVIPTAWDKKQGSTMQVAEFNVGM